MADRDDDPGEVIYAAGGCLVGAIGAHPGASRLADTRAILVDAFEFWLSTEQAQEICAMPKRDFLAAIEAQCRKDLPGNPWIVRRKRARRGTAEAANG